MFPNYIRSASSIGQFTRRWVAMHLSMPLLLLFLSISTHQAIADESQTNEQIKDIAPLLADKNTRDEGLELLFNSTAPKTRDWISALLEGDLYIRKSDGLPFIVEKQGKKYLLTDATSGEMAGEAGRREVSKIKINNTIRSRLRSARASLSLRDDDPKVRLAAVERMMQNGSDADIEAIENQMPQEKNKNVASLMATTLWLSELNSDDEQVRLAAIDNIGVNTRDTVVNRLRKVAQDDPSESVVAAATAQLVEIDNRISIYEKIETVFFGLSLGSVLALAAIGLAITFGVMGVINMAHGEMIMLGAYTTWAMQVLMPNFVEYSLIIAIPAAFVVAFLVGVLIEVLVIRHLYGRPLETLLATFGISLILQQTVRTLISPQNVPVSNPAWLSGLWEVDPALTFAINRIVIFGFCVAIFLTLMWLLKYTYFGLKVRAVAQNRQMARSLGARSSSIDAATFGLGAGIAGVAGVALSQLTNVGPNMGQAYIVDSFMVVVFGGVGNLWGTLLAGLSLGVFNKVLEPWAGAVLAKILVLVFIILFIQKYPKGLFPQRGRAAGD